MCFHDKRLWSVVTEHRELPQKVGAESMEFTVMPKHGFSPRATSITVGYHISLPIIPELLLRKWLSETGALEEKALGFH